MIKIDILIDANGQNEEDIIELLCSQIEEVVINHDCDNDLLIASLIDTDYLQKMRNSFTTTNRRHIN